MASQARLFKVVDELGKECVWTQSITPHEMVQWSVVHISAASNIPIVTTHTYILPTHNPFAYD